MVNEDLQQSLLYLQKISWWLSGVQHCKSPLKDLQEFTLSGNKGTRLSETGMDNMSGDCPANDFEKNKKVRSTVIIGYGGGKK